MCFGIILIIIEIAMQTYPGDAAQMTFRLIDREHWDCKEYFGHCFSQSPCTYSAVFQLDITRIPQQGQKLYPTIHSIPLIISYHSATVCRFTPDPSAMVL